MTTHLIGGAWQPGTGEVFQSTDPAFGDVVWEGAAASKAQVDRAYAAARAAFPGWARTSLDERIDMLQRFKSVLEERTEVFAETISREVGKVLWETRAELGAMKGKVDLSIKSYNERTGQSISDAAFGRSELAHRPHGVMAVMGPFNFPGHLPNGHIVPALLAGNTVVFKPSEFAPATGQLLVEALREVGCPDGVVNLVQGGRDTGTALLEGDLDGVLFTGSAGTGKYIHKLFGGRPEVLLALEMGGNNPLIAWDFDDVDAAADIAAQSAFLTTGQRCSCARRLIIEDNSKGRALIDGIIDRATKLNIGDWKTEDAFMGPLVHAQAAENALKFEAQLSGLGGTSLLAVSRTDQSSAHVTPGVMDMTNTREFHDEELFGPFLQVVRVSSFDAALVEANRTRFGLAGGLVSDREALWNRAHTEMRAGILNWNRPTAGASSALPFGGPGLSGNHRPSAWYAADYCAWPQASQIAPKPERLSAVGFPK